MWQPHFLRNLMAFGSLSAALPAYLIGGSLGVILGFFSGLGGVTWILFQDPDYRQLKTDADRVLQDKDETAIKRKAFNVLFFSLLFGLAFEKIMQPPFNALVGAVSSFMVFFYLAIKARD
jgi:hypothetical protein